MISVTLIFEIKSNGTWRSDKDILAKNRQEPTCWWANSLQFGNFSKSKSMRGNRTLVDFLSWRKSDILSAERSWESRLEASLVKLVSVYTHLCARHINVTSDIVHLCWIRGQAQIWIRNPVLWLSGWKHSLSRPLASFPIPFCQWSSVLSVWTSISINNLPDSFPFHSGRVLL